MGNETSIIWLAAPGKLPAALSQYHLPSSAYQVIAEYLVMAEHLVTLNA